MSMKRMNIRQSIILKSAVLCFFVFSVFLFNSCNIYKTLQNVTRLKFKLNTIDNLQLSGIPISNRKSIKDFNAVELLKLSSGVAKGNLPLTFTLHVNAFNPNDGKGGYPRTDLKLSSFPWRLLIDDKETISGNISSPVVVPGVGEAVDFPLQINFDLYKFFNDKGYEGLMNLALRLSELGGSSVDVKLAAKPTISSSIGNITYPNELFIVHQEYR